MSEYSQELNDIAFLALDHGVSIIEKNQGPLIPFAIVNEKSGEKKLEAFAIEPTGEGLNYAKKHIDENAANIERYAIAWDGYVTIEGTKWDAIFVEAGETLSEDGYIMAQRYEKQGFLKKRQKPIGNPLIVEEIKSRVSNP